MGINQKILVSTKGQRTGVANALLALFAFLALAMFSLLSACGQKGSLYLPNDPEFQQRATLPEIVKRQLPFNEATPPSNAASSTAPAPAPAKR